ncbi:unnamed protein product [Cylicostephanus goldi]|uniref:Major facilitator superfamily (MFS) profile domain-containing protein n=1 Tax=Cylicostephanus goldi TaxID=71465 RepID=A0A3P6T8I9_CYLGO|nr:unnamed protein product [Cylicostephanus goldi]
MAFFEFFSVAAVLARFCKLVNFFCKRNFSGSIPWFFVSEIFASNSRSNANSVAVMVNWTANLLVGLSFLSLNNALAQYSFLVFTALLSFFIFFTWRFVPETKGKTVEEITATFDKRKR